MSLQSVKILPTKNSSDQEWLSWYLDLKNLIGTKKANRIFTMLWNNEDGYNSDANSVYLRDEMEGYGVEIAGGVIGDVADFFSTAKGYFGGFFTAGKWISIALAGVVVVSVGGLLLQIAFKPSVRQEAVKIGTAIGTRGMSELPAKK